MIRLLRNLIKRAIVTKAGKDDGALAVQQISHNGKASQSEIVFPYGVHANLPVDSLLTCFLIEGVEQNKAAIGGMPQNRIKNLPVGEVVFFHPLTKSKLHFKNGGEIEVVAVKDGEKKNITIDLLNMTITAEEDFTVNCSKANVNATDSVNIDSPLTNLGVGGNKIARLGDTVQVTVTAGSSAGTYNGTITSSGVNTSI